MRLGGPLGLFINYVILFWATSLRTLIVTIKKDAKFADPDEEVKIDPIGETVEIENLTEMSMMVDPIG